MLLLLLLLRLLLRLWLGLSIEWDGGWIEWLDVSVVQVREESGSLWVRLEVRRRVAIGTLYGLRRWGWSSVEASVCRRRRRVVEVWRGATVSKVEMRVVVVWHSVEALFEVAWELILVVVVQVSEPVFVLGQGVLGVDFSAGYRFADDGVNCVFGVLCVCVGDEAVAL